MNTKNTHINRIIKRDASCWRFFRKKMFMIRIFREKKIFCLLNAEF